MSDSARRAHAPDDAGPARSYPPRARVPEVWASPRPRLYWQMLANFIDTWPQSLYHDLVVDCAPHFPRTLFVCDPGIIRQIFRQGNAKYRISWQQRRICSALFGGATIATSEAGDWRADRQLYENALSAPRLDWVSEQIVANAHHLCDRWSDISGVVQVDHGVGRFALRNIAAIALSWQPSAYLDTLSADLEAASDSIGRITAAAFFRLLKFVPTSARGRGARSLSTLEANIHREIGVRRVSGRPGDDFLGDYLRAQARDAQGRFDDRRIVANVMALIASGFDTTAAALNWFLYLLAANPQVQAAVRSELQALEGGGVNQPAGRTPIARAALQETLRLYPSLPLLAREAIEPDEIAGRRIAAGTTVFVSPYLVHRHRRLWQDPDAFDPYRFLGDRRKEHVDGAYLPFGVGQRTCVGFQLANREILTAAAVILTRFTLALDTTAEIRVRSRMGLKPAGGVTLRLTPR